MRRTPTAGSPISGFASFTIFAALLALLSVAEQTAPAAPPEKPSPEEQSSIEARRLPHVYRPPEVVKLAEACVASLPPDETPPDAEARQAATDDFVRCYLEGFMNPAATMGGSKAGEAGFKAGQEFRHAHAEKIKQTFESYGYVATEVVGIWTSGFEQSHFKPRGARAKESWWISGARDAADFRYDGKPDKGVAVRITGYLSPPGFYGHMGTGDHEFFATKIRRAD